MQVQVQSSNLTLYPYGTWNITWPYAMKSRVPWSWSPPYCTWRGGTLSARRAATLTWRSAEDSFHKNKNSLRNLFRPQTWILQLQLYSSEQCSTTTCQYQLPYYIDITYTYSYIWYVMTSVLQKTCGYSTILNIFIPRRMDRLYVQYFNNLHAFACIELTSNYRPLSILWNCLCRLAASPVNRQTQTQYNYTTRKESNKK